MLHAALRCALPHRSLAARTQPLYSVKEFTNKSLFNTFITVVAYLIYLTYFLYLYQLLIPVIDSLH